MLCGKTSQGAHATGSVQPADSLVEGKSVCRIAKLAGLKLHLCQPMMLCAKVCGSDSLESIKGSSLETEQYLNIPPTL
jgi:hypothetical protein